MSFNLEHINILFHAFTVCSSRLLCPLIYLCFRPRNILIQNKQFYFDSYLYVKCGREGGGRGCGKVCVYVGLGLVGGGGCCWGWLVIAPVLCCLLKQPFFSSSPGIVQDILSVD